jgi:hypothetical protein
MSKSVQAISDPIADDIPICERCDKANDDGSIEFYEDEEGGGIWCCDDCLDS